MEKQKQKNLLILSNLFFIFFVILILPFTVSAINIDQIIKEKNTLDNISKIKNKVVSDKTYIFTPEGFVKLKRNDLLEDNIAIGKGIIAITGDYKKETEVNFYTDMPNTPFSVLHYDGITSNKQLVRDEGTTFIKSVMSDKNGVVTYLSSNFSTQILAFPDPLEHAIGSVFTGYYLNYFFDDYDRVRVTSVDIGISGTTLDDYLTSEESYEDDDTYTDSELQLILKHSGSPPTTNPRLMMYSYATVTDWSYDITVRAYDDVDDINYVEDTFEWEKTGGGAVGVYTILNLTDPTVKTVNQSFSFFLSDYLADFTTGGVFFVDTNCNNTNNGTMNATGDITVIAGATNCYVLIGGNSNVSDDGGSYTNPYFYSFDTYGTGADIIILGTSLIVHNFTTFTLVGYDSETPTGNATADYVTLEIQTLSNGSYNLTPSLIAYYTFDDADITSTNADDVTGNGNTATNINTVTTGVTGVSNEAFDFDNASSERLNVSTALTSQLSSTSFSYFAWIKPEITLTDGTSDYQAIVWGGTGSYEHRLFYYDGDFNYATLVGTWATSVYDTDLNASTWYHVGVVFNDTSNQQSLYFDGVNVANSSQSAPLTFTGSASIGSNVVSGQYFNGFIDELGVWDRALTPQDISDLYDGGVEGYDGLVGEPEGVPPVQLDNLPSLIDLEYDELILFEFNDYFSGYDEIIINFNATNGTPQTINTTTNDTNNYNFNDSGVEFDLIGITTNLRWYITAFLNNYSSPITVFACNEGTCINDTSNLTISAVIIEPVPPTRIAFFNAQYNMTYSDFDTYNLGGYYSNYNEIQIIYYDSENATNYSISHTVGDATNNIDLDDITLTLHTVTTNVVLDITSKDTDNSNVLEIIAINPYGDISSSTQITIYEPTSSAFTSLLGSLGGVFPDSDDLTTSNKMLYVVVTLLVTIGAIMLGGTQTNLNIPAVALVSISALLVVLEVIFFVAIGYIPIILIIVLGLIGVFIAWSLMKRTGVGGV